MIPLKKYLEAVQARAKAKYTCAYHGDADQFDYVTIPKLVAMCLEMAAALDHINKLGTSMDPDTLQGDPNLEAIRARKSLAAVAKIAEGG